MGGPVLEWGFHRIIVTVGGVNLRELSKDGKVSVTPLAAEIYTSKVDIDGIPTYVFSNDRRGSLKLDFIQLAAANQFMFEKLFSQMTRSIRGLPQTPLPLSIIDPVSGTTIVSPHLVMTKHVGLEWGSDTTDRSFEMEIPDMFSLSTIYNMRFATEMAKG